MVRLVATIRQLVRTDWLDAYGGLPEMNFQICEVFEDEEYSAHIDVPMSQGALMGTAHVTTTRAENASTVRCEIEISGIKPSQTTLLRGVDQVSKYLRRHTVTHNWKNGEATCGKHADITSLCDEPLPLMEITFRDEKK